MTIELIHRAQRHRGLTARHRGRRSLGDLSHKVYAPLGSEAKPEELLFLDVWVDAEGIGKFLPHPDVAARGAQLFTHKEPTMWMPVRVSCAASTSGSIALGKALAGRPSALTWQQAPGQWSEW